MMIEHVEMMAKAEIAPVLFHVEYDKIIQRRERKPKQEKAVPAPEEESQNTTVKKAPADEQKALKKIKKEQ